MCHWGTGTECFKVAVYSISRFRVVPSLFTRDAMMLTVQEGWVLCSEFQDQRNRPHWLARGLRSTVTTWGKALALIGLIGGCNDFLALYRLLSGCDAELFELLEHAGKSFLLSREFACAGPVTPLPLAVGRSFCENPCVVCGNKCTWMGA